MDYVTCNLMGGLGNNLFQISAAYALSLRDNKKFILNSNNIKKQTKNDYLSNLFSKVPIEKDLIKYRRINEKTFNYSELPKIEGNVEIYGYYQSEKYFYEYRNKILSLFDVDNSIFEDVLNKYKEILLLETCSIHVRRGDYLNLKDYHTVLPIDYFKKSYNKMGSHLTYLIFSDDIEWCKDNFDFISKKVFVSDNKDYEDLYLMSQCDNNIISNSTFSWWGAWLNKNENKVIAPKKWFGPKNYHLSTKDIYSKKWNVL